MTILIKQVCRAMEHIAPLRLAEKWDNVGLLLESPVVKPRNKNAVLLTIDLTRSVLEEALAAEASVIVSYHPPIFSPLKALTLSNPLQANLLKCAAEGISVFTPHTALDSTWSGITDWLVRCGGEDGEIKVLGNEKFSPEGLSEGGEGRIIAFRTSRDMSELETRIKEYLGLFTIQVAYASTSSTVRSLAVCAGSGASVLLGKQADVYLTGEMSHHEVLAAVASGTHVILCGHSNTERGYLPSLADRLRKELSAIESKEGVEVIVSKQDKHPSRFV